MFIPRQIFYTNLFFFLFCSPIPEIRTWQKIYLIDHNTQPIAKKRDPWQFGYNPWKRRLDDHKPIYIPRCLRENPRKRRIGRWAKSYYPDA